MFYQALKNALFPIRTGDYITTDLGFKKVLNNNDPLFLGRVLTNCGWTYPHHN